MEHSDVAQQRHRAYLRHLEAVNRERRRVQSTAAQGADVEFRTCFSGANADRARQRRRRAPPKGSPERQQDRGRGIFILDGSAYPTQNPEMSSSAARPKRRGWSPKPPPFIKGQQGPVRVQRFPGKTPKPRELMTTSEWKACEDSGETEAPSPPDYDEYEDDYEEDFESEDPTDEQVELASSVKAESVDDATTPARDSEGTAEDSQERPTSLLSDIRTDGPPDRGLHRPRTLSASSMDSLDIAHGVDDIVFSMRQSTPAQALSRSRDKTATAEAQNFGIPQTTVDSPSANSKSSKQRASNRKVESSPDSRLESSVGVILSSGNLEQALLAAITQLGKDQQMKLLRRLQQALDTGNQDATGKNRNDEISVSLLLKSLTLEGGCGVDQNVHVDGRRDEKGAGKLDPIDVEHQTLILTLYSTWSNSNVVALRNLHVLACSEEAETNLDILRVRLFRGLDRTPLPSRGLSDLIQRRGVRQRDLNPWSERLTNSQPLRLELTIPAEANVLVIQNAAGAQEMCARYTELTVNGTCVWEGDLEVSLERVTYIGWGNKSTSFVLDKQSSRKSSNCECSILCEANRQDATLQSPKPSDTVNMSSVLKHGNQTNSRQRRSRRARCDQSETPKQANVRDKPSPDPASTEVPHEGEKPEQFVASPGTMGTIPRSNHDDVEASSLRRTDHARSEPNNDMDTLDAALAAPFDEPLRTPPDLRLLPVAPAESPQPHVCKPAEVFKSVVIADDLGGSPSRFAEIQSVAKEAKSLEHLLNSDSSLATSRNQPPAKVGTVPARVKASRAIRIRDPQIVQMAELRIEIESTWGDRRFCGLCGFALLDASDTYIALDPCQLQCEPRDLCDAGYSGDPRKMENLLNMQNVTNAEEDMWLIPFEAGQKHWMTVVFPTSTALAGMAFWNYNKSLEDTSRGVKDISVYCDGKKVRTATLRPAPGIGPNNELGFWDFCQVIRFRPTVYTMKPPGCASVRSSGFHSDQLWETQQKPSGLLLRFVLHSTLGDDYYIGLDAIDIITRGGRSLYIHPLQVSAVPYSLAVLGQSDARVPGNLVVPTTKIGWLAPKAGTLGGSCKSKCVENEVVIALDEPAEIYQIVIKNYSKTPARGVKDLSVYLDHALLYQGVLAPSDGKTTRNLIHFGDQTSRSGFSSMTGKRSDQEILMVDEGKVRAHARKDPSESSPMTDIGKRPATSAGA